MSVHQSVSIVIPAKNEEASITQVVEGVRRAVAGAQVIVVDDGSTDSTGDRARAAGASVVRHPVSRGNGAAIKAGARAATGDVLVFMDADGQHSPAEIARLLAGINEGYDLVVGARSRGAQANWARWFGNAVYNRLSSWLVGQHVADLTSGFRAARADKFREFLYLLPNGFSYPTTSTMAFFRAGYSVAFVPVEVGRRNGRSHIRIVRDGGRFLLIIFRVATLYAPLKVFTPMGGFIFALGLAYSTYTLVEFSRFTNFGALLFVTSLLVFLIGLVSEQITMLIYKK